MFLRLLLNFPIFIGQIFQFILVSVIIGSLSFFLGQLLPRKNFDWTMFPYKSFAWERNGLVYTRLKIQFWKDRVPDMSRYIRSVFRKKICVFRSGEYLEGLIRETCVAELVHWMLIFVSPIFMLQIDGIGGIIGTICYAIGNLPFILIQRYNRPRLVMLLERQQCAVKRLNKVGGLQSSTAG